MPLRGTHRVGGVKPINIPKSRVLGSGQQKGLGLQTAAMGAVMSARGTSIAVAKQHPNCMDYGQRVCEEVCLP